LLSKIIANLENMLLLKNLARILISGLKS